MTQQPLMVRVIEEQPKWHRKDPVQQLAEDIEEAIWERVGRQPFILATDLSNADKLKAMVVAAIHEQLVWYFAKN